MPELIYAAVDLETTGLNPQTDEIIEVGVVRCTPDQVLERWSTLVQPKTMPSLRVQRLTGIKPDDLSDAPPFAEVEEEVRRRLSDAAWVGHNIPFDEEFLAGVGIAPPRPSVDTLPLAQILDPASPSHRLSDLCRRHKIETEQSHRALSDADAARGLLIVLRGLCQNLPPDVRDSLLEIAAQLGFNWPTGRVLTEWIVAADIGDAEVSPVARTPLPVHREPQRVALPADGGSLADLTERAFTPDDGDGVLLERRDEQIGMARDVADVLERGDVGIVEAGTGTGKSLAYLVPAALRALDTGRRALISTHTINLQQQLMTNDLPMARQLVERVAPRAAGRLSAAIVKGRGNYLCRRKLQQLRSAVDDPDTAQLASRASVWEAQTETGDRAEVRLTPHESARWDRLSSSGETCLSDGCPFVRNESCFLLRAQRLAEAAHIVVVNHALLISDLEYGAVVVPDAHMVIIDESHALEDAATDQLSEAMGEDWLGERLDEIFSEARSREQGLAAEAMGVAPQAAIELRGRVRQMRLELSDLYDRLAAFASEHAEDQYDGDDRLTLSRGVRAQPGWAQIEENWERAAGQLGEINAALSEVARSYGDAAREERDDLQRREELLLQAEDIGWVGATLAERGARMAGVLHDYDDSVIAWLHRNRRSGSAFVHSAPLSVAPRLRELWEERGGVVLTGATLATDRGFNFLRERLGLADAAESQYGSPFDYERAARIYLPDDAEEATASNHHDEVARALGLLAPAAGGRTMALFTSHGAMRQVARRVEESLAAAGLVLVLQGRDGSAAAVAAALRNDPRTVAFGVASLWTGVDLPGDSLSLLVITRLPFWPPTDPVTQVRSDQYDNPFMDYSLPAAIIRFRQGIGRLIRRRSDRGAVVILDDRVSTKRYGKQFLRALPPAPVLRMPVAAAADDLREFLPPRDDAGPSQ